jgi:hypothetical protein
LQKTGFERLVGLRLPIVVKKGIIATAKTTLASKTINANSGIDAAQRRVNTPRRAMRRRGKSPVPNGSAEDLQVSEFTGNPEDSIDITL